jgi:hypothetical protein
VGVSRSMFKSIQVTKCLRCYYLSSTIYAIRVIFSLPSQGGSRTYMLTTMPCGGQQSKGLTVDQHWISSDLLIWVQDGLHCTISGTIYCRVQDGLWDYLL